MTPSFHVALRLEGRHCLVIAEGSEAEMRARALLDSGAIVTVFSMAPTPELLALDENPRVSIEVRAASLDDLHAAQLCVASGVTLEFAQALKRRADELGILYCAVDVPEQSNFFHLALARKGPVTISIGTTGAAPALARRLREELERVLDDASFEAFVEELVTLRERTPSNLRANVLGEAVKRLRLDGKLRVDAG